MSDATVVTGSSGARAPRRGDVLGERYEIVEALASDALVCTYRGNDQESDATVLVRCTAPGLLGERDARRLVERGKAVVGGGARLLSPLRDVDREGALVFTVEAWPRGTSLRAVLDARRAKGTTFEAREMLPLIARLAAAIASIPEPWSHGDVRAERVWVDPDGVVLTGAFLISLLPGDAVADALRDASASGLRSVLAPELADGMGGRASDRWGAAAIVWEAMTGRPVAAAPTTLPDALGRDALGGAAVEIARLLSADPAARPASLDALVAKIAELARMPVPRVELDPFPIRTIETAPDDATQVASDLGPATERPPPFSATFGDPPTERSASVSLDAMENDLQDLRTDPAARPLSGQALSTPAGRRSSRPAPAKADDTAPHAALGPDGRLGPDGKIAEADDLDPRLVRAALADHELDSRELELVDEKTGKTKQPAGGKADDLDPRLVRAALGLAFEDAPTEGAKPKPAPQAAAKGAKPKRSAAVTQELDASELEIVRGDKAGAKGQPAAAPRAAAPAAKAAVAKPGAAISPPAKAGSLLAPGAAPAPVRKKPVRAPEPVTLPADIKPIPRPQVGASDSGEMKGPVLFDASRPQPPPAAAPPPAMAPRAPAPMPAPIASPAPAGPIGSAGAGPHPGYAQPPRPAPRAAAPPAARGAPAWASWAIVIGAILLGVVIVAGGFWYRATLQREAEQQQFIEQRLRELQQQR